MTLCLDLRFHFAFHNQPTDLTCHAIFTNISNFSFCMAFVKPFYGPFGIIYNFLFPPTCCGEFEIDAAVIRICASFSSTSEIHLAYWTVCVREPFQKIYIRLAYQKTNEKKQHAWATQTTMPSKTSNSMKWLTRAWFIVPIPRSSVKIALAINKNIKNKNQTKLPTTNNNINATGAHISAFLLWQSTFLNKFFFLSFLK